MITAVNTQALASSVSESRTEKPSPEQLFKQLDSGDKGYLTADDLQAAVVKISAEGASRAQSSAPSSSRASTEFAPSAQDVIAQLDRDGDGKVTEHEFKDGAPLTPQTRVTVDTPRAGAAAAGSPPPGTAGGGGASALSSSSQTFDPADANEDGKVSTQEQQSYDARLAADKAAQAAASSRSSAGADAAVKAYAAVEQLSHDSGTPAT